MFAHSLKRVAYLAATFTFAVFVSVSAADVLDAARSASEQIDRDLRDSAARLTRQLDQSERQIREAHRLGAPDSVPNRYGEAAAIDRRIGATADIANRQLDRAAVRDDYMLQRQVMENNRSLYYPKSDGWNSYTRKLEELDRDFAVHMNSMAR